MVIQRNRGRCIHISTEFFEAVIQYDVNSGDLSAILPVSGDRVVTQMHATPPSHADNSAFSTLNGCGR